MSNDRLLRFATETLNQNQLASGCFDDSSELVIFGSRSVGLERRSSDLDVLCIGTKTLKFKTPRLDLIGIRIDDAHRENWLSSELASHIAHYGTWIKGRPSWVEEVHIGSNVIHAKRKRIVAFLRALPSRWSNLEVGFQEKYAKKLRRETQRLLLLQRGIAIPPTRILDHDWNAYSISRDEIESCLLRSMSTDNLLFRRDLLARIDAELCASPTLLKPPPLQPAK